MDIINHKHSFKIGDHEVELLINCRNGAWKSEIIKGDTGTGTCSGGRWASLEEYIKAQEREHIYSYHFFNHGYKAAKKAIE